MSSHQERPDRIVIVGATSAIAEHCARLWLQQAAVHLTLVGRDRAKLDALAADLRVRSPGSELQTRVVDFVDARAIGGLVDELVTAGPLQRVLIAHGALPDQPACERDLEAVAAALAINGSSPLLFAEAFAGAMQRANAGCLAVIGSVAGDRGRKSNYVYGAAKGMVERYVQGLQHRLAASAVKVVLIKPGPTDTPMTAELKRQGRRLAPVQSVAAGIVEAMRRGRPVAYLPPKWALIMAVVRLLPRRIFNRLDL